MAYPQYPEPERPGPAKRLIYLIIFIGILAVTSLLILIGYVLNTVFDSNLASQPLYSQLPVAAQTAFGSVVTYTLSTYGFYALVVVIIAIAGTLAAIFGVRAPENDDF